MFGALLLYILLETCLCCSAAKIPNFLYERETVASTFFQLHSYASYISATLISLQWLLLYGLAFSVNSKEQLL